MTMGRYVLLLLAASDAPWVRSVRERVAATAWPAELLICEHPHEVCVRLASGRRHSALLIDGPTELDPDVADAADAAGTPVIACGSGPGGPYLGQLTGGQAGSIRPVPWGDRLPPWVAELLGTATGPPARRGRLIGVCGPGGTGASVVAMALAQGLAPSEDVLLADFARRAHQSLLHRISGGAGGLLGLLTRFRGRSPSTAEVRASTLPLAGQRYRLLPGLDRVHHWALVNPRSFDTGLSALQAEFELVIADITGDFEGEADTGSLEVEERNHVSRRVALRADLVVVVGGTGRTTRHAAAETLESLSALGVNAARMLTATNRVSSSRGTGGNGLSLPEVVLTEDGPLPASLVVPLREAALAALRRLPSPPEEVRFHPVVPGTIGRWGEPA